MTEDKINYNEFARDMANPWDPAQLKKLRNDLSGEWGRKTYSAEQRGKLLAILNREISAKERQKKAGNVANVRDAPSRRSGNPKPPQGGVTLTNIARFVTGKPKKK